MSENLEKMKAEIDTANELLGEVEALSELPDFDEQLRISFAFIYRLKTHLVTILETKRTSTMKWSDVNAYMSTILREIREWTKMAYSKQIGSEASQFGIDFLNSLFFPLEQPRHDSTDSDSGEPPIRIASGGK